MQTTSRSQHLENLPMVSLNAEKNLSSSWASDDETNWNFEVNSKDITGM